MNKITLLVLFALVALQSWAQAECTNTFSGSGNDNEGASIDITSDDLDCAGDAAISSFTISDFSAGFYCGSWYDYDLIIDDETIVSGGCQSDFVDVAIPTDFTSIQIVANDIDDYGDSITFSVDISSSFPASEIPNCDATLETFELAFFEEISWSAATGYPSSYNLTIGSTSGGDDILASTNVGDVTSYSLADLDLEGDTEYYVTITPENSIGVATGCVEQMFTTYPILANDECSGAIELTVNDEECDVVTSGSTLGASASDQEDDVTGTPNTDVWYSFIATEADLIVTISNVVNQGGGTSTSLDMGMGVYDASNGCEALVLVDDSDPNTLELSNLNVGDEYYVRVYGWYSSTQYNTFDLCVKGQPEAPDNDECSGAIELTVNEGECDVVTSGTTVGATASDQEDDVTGTPNTDVWYSFIATEANVMISLSNVVNQGGGTSTSTDMGMAVYDASNGCEALVLVDDSDPNNMILNGLSVGEEYYVRVYGWSSSIQFNTFDLCVNTLPEAPANDECSGAITLTVNEGAECTIVTEGSTVGATASVLASDEEDDITGTPNTDVWYSFIATESLLEVSLLNVVHEGGESSSVDMGMAVYDASNGCEALVLVDDSDPNTLELSGLNVGDEYYVRVYGWGTGVTYNTFDVCVKGLPEPPANDDCVNAIALTVGESFDDNSVDGTVLGATDDGLTVSCGSNGPGVWYSIVVPEDGQVTIETSVDSEGTEGFDSVIEAFSGSCGELVSIDCDDDGADEGNFSLLELSELTAGETIYIRVWEYGGNDTEPFSISAYTGTLSATSFSDNEFSYYPNPVNNNILNLSAQDNIQNVVVYNLVGQQVLAVQPNVNDYTLNMSSLKEGAYFVSVTIANATETVKIIKK